MSPKKYLVIAKLENTQFTDPTPTPTANSMLVKNLKCTPLKVTSEDRNLMRPWYGNSEQIPVSEEGMIEFDVEIAGSGAAGTAPKWGPLMQACAFYETTNAGVSVVYQPISSALKSIQIWAYRDGLLYKFSGAVGTVKMSFAAKKLPEFHFVFTGKYVAVSDAAIPSGAVFTGFQKPVASIPALMGTVTIGGYAAKLSQFDLDMANDVSHAIWMNNETLAVVDRKPKGSIQVEAVTVATKDYWTLVRNASTMAAVLTQGITAGNIVALTAPAMQLVDINESEFEKTQALTLTTAFMPSTGNDEVFVTCT